MKKIIILLIFTLHSLLFFSQEIPAEYKVFAKRADSLYKQKNYKESALMYSKAFQTLDGKGKINDRYKAACSWAKADYPDSAFFNLDRIATKLDSGAFEFMKIEKDLRSLYSDKRWGQFLEKAKANQKEFMSDREIVMNNPVRRKGFYIQALQA